MGNQREVESAKGTQHSNTRIDMRQVHIMRSPVYLERGYTPEVPRKRSTPRHGTTRSFSRATHGNSGGAQMILRVRHSQRIYDPIPHRASQHSAQRQRALRLPYRWSRVGQEALANEGQHPVVSIAERPEIVRHIAFVDEIVVETLPNRIESWRAHSFDVISKRDYWRGIAKGNKFERDFAVVGVEVVYFPDTIHTLSTFLQEAPNNAAS